MVTETTWTFSAKNRRFVVACLREDQVTYEYVSWLNDVDNRRFISWQNDVSIESQKQYISEIRRSDDRLLLGLSNESGTLIGTSGMHEVGVIEAPTAYMGIFLGHPQYRGLGLGSIWVSVCASILFESFKAKRVTAGSLTANRPSVESFLKAGFVVEKTIKRSKYVEGFGWSDTVLMGCGARQLAPVDDIGLRVER